MANVLAVDQAALGTLRSALGATADTVAALHGTTGGLDQAAAGLPGTATATACTGAGPILIEGLTLIAERVRATSDAVGQAIEAYTQAQDELVRALHHIGI